MWSVRSACTALTLNDLIDFNEMRGLFSGRLAAALPYTDSVAEWRGGQHDVAINYAGSWRSSAAVNDPSVRDYMNVA
jgi:hypothetical protein